MLISVVHLIPLICEEYSRFLSEYFLRFAYAVVLIKVEDVLHEKMCSGIQVP